MTSLAQNLRQILESHFASAWLRGTAPAVRPVLIGPPADALTTLFDLLTDGGTRDWQITVAGQPLDVIVLFVRPANVSIPPRPPHAPVSQHVRWDYAVTVRNSRQLVLMLVEPSAWDNRPESLANTTETIGAPDIGHGTFKDSCWQELLQRISQALGVDQKITRSILYKVTRESQSLDPSTRDRVPWSLANSLLPGAWQGLSGAETLAAAAGLPSPGQGTSASLNDAQEALQELSRFLGDEGLGPGLDKLRGTVAALRHGVIPFLDALHEHLKTTAPSARAFEHAPYWHYRPGHPPQDWWHQLTVTVWQEMLGEFDQKPRQPLELLCENAVNATPVRGEPFIVEGDPRLRALSPPVVGPVVATFKRKVRNGAETQLTSDPVDQALCIDATVPQHKAPLRYTTSAQALKPASIDVLVLNHFEGRGLVRVPDALKCSAPAYSKQAGTWSQAFTLARGGTTELHVYHPATTSAIEVSRQGAILVSHPCAVGSTRTILREDIEDADTYEIKLLDSQANAVVAWIVQFTIDEATSVKHSYFECLVAYHRGKGERSTPRPPDTLINRFEFSQYLQHPDSWRPVLAGFSRGVSGQLRIDDWTDPRLGDVHPQVDSRLAKSPPQDVLASREAVRQLLLQHQRTVSEIPLGQEAIHDAVVAYVTSYRSWLQSNPANATWFDCIVVHGAQRNVQAGLHIATPEPVVILLSPLHPLRLGWHCVAQRQLERSQPRCPAAGVLDPATCPDSGTWYLARAGRSSLPRAFVSMQCLHPHWGVLINRAYVNNDDLRDETLQRLAELGLSVQGIAGGFTSAQAVDSLDEVNRLLPARAALRVGIVGTSQSSSACADGIIDWCQDRLESEESAAAGPFSIDVFDTRESDDPSPEKLAALSEGTAERARWFKLAATDPVPQLDLSIIDQLDTSSPGATKGTARSPISPGALYRVRVREDFENARLVAETRIARGGLADQSLPGLVGSTVALFESTMTADESLSRFEFRPNQEAVGRRLQSSTFLAVTSSQIDPACMVRGAIGQDGYLWDYELPGVMGGTESNIGYYLLARPINAMEEAIERSATLIVSPPPNVRVMLNEISRHGIPILKRLASGGTQARGELGLLLAVRLLQDVFRDNASNVRLPVWRDRCIHLLLPVDPYEDAFERVRKELCTDANSKRPDLIVISIFLPPEDAAVGLKITPIEVKFREAHMPLADRREALKQAANLGKISQRAWVEPPPSDLWATCSRALLAQCLDFAFRIYADPDVHEHDQHEWTATHERVLQDVLEGRANIDVNTAGRLLVFDDSAVTSILDLDDDSVTDTVVVSRTDSRVLLTSTGTLSVEANECVNRLGLSFPWCADGVSPPTSFPGSVPPPSGPSAGTPSVQGSSQMVPPSPAQIGSPTTPVTDEARDAAVAPGGTGPKSGAFDESQAPADNSVQERSTPVMSQATPTSLVGWTEPASRWAAVGKLTVNAETVAIDLDHPKTVGIFGYMGSGKSYLLGNLIESAVQPVQGINSLAAPLAVVVFNYRRNASDRFELASLGVPNANAADADRLEREYSAAPQALKNLHVLALPGELRPARLNEYGGLGASELFFNPHTLGAEDWELLMGEPGSEAVFARTIRNTLVDLRGAGDITLENLEQETIARLTGGSKTAAKLRFDFVRRYISAERGVDFEQLLQPGRVLIVDLRQPLFNKDDALRFFLVCANQISKVQGRFNKMLVFDEAHEYMSEAFGERMQERIRLMRHEGTSYVFATQDVRSIPMGISRFLGTRFVFDLGTRENAQDLEQAAPEFRGYQLLGVKPGHCYIHANISTNGTFARPREIRVRPRVTQHGGASQIFSNPQKRD